MGTRLNKGKGKQRKLMETNLENQKKSEEQEGLKNILRVEIVQKNSIKEF